MHRLERRVLPTLVVAATAFLAGCSSGGTKDAAPTSAAAGCASATTVAGSDRGAEVNPPGDIPDDQAFVAYSPPDNSYTVKVPEGWARTDGSRQVTFTDKLNAIDIQVVERATAPTVESTKAEDVPVLAAAEPCFRLGEVKTAKRKAGTAVLATYGADSPADPVTGKVVFDDVERYTFWKDGRAAVLRLSGPAGSDNVDPWRIVTDSFAWR